ncbi:hypothetical protein PIB30_014050 [Stylosanthes scabra]|uniref:Uncharacterized protein n=1 Tax=Stylosanthes scabra TaxID=79078 RepID=A0ABU6Q6G5_9FABA|nr:hypothetical protein [Stylosanthes scabra]
MRKQCYDPINLDAFEDHSDWILKESPQFLSPEEIDALRNDLANMTLQPVSDDIAILLYDGLFLLLLSSSSLSLFLTEIYHHNHGVTSAADPPLLLDLIDIDDEHIDAFQKVLLEDVVIATLRETCTPTNPAASVMGQ